MTSAHTSCSVARQREATALPRLGTRWLGVAAVLAALIWSYWPVIKSLISEWRTDDNYSVGGLIPLVAIALLWGDRKKLAQCTVRPSLWGLALIIPALLARACGMVALFESAERYSLVVMIAGLVLLMGGREVFRKTVWALLFLLLMVPLPGRVHNLVSGPLQSLATTGTVMTLELLGITVVQEGHMMVVNDNLRVGVAEACSGLRMLTAFVAVAAGMAYIIGRPPWQKLILLCSSIPIAILCNWVRAVVTVFLLIAIGSNSAEKFFHDFAGFAMMPLALIALVVELRILSLLLIEDKHEQLIPS
jgi:exosortase